ncbi:hypothetical protein P154DRAFT_530685 [Amniculicola lignicola CBS 123094]|uniref:F-box domain-containing protein n=1 Tax=Amniculicola lignicola CBS 123094 TaxID=1392246 RepID=A0A6A5WWZ0_9PLEO|nr:hypothetical protein P154DRAFT_530685 [Amniculicola lignicola CBS 123094]
MRAFPFLDLPKELRLMVYEAVPIVEQECTLRNPNFYIITLRVRELPVDILATCRFIYEEAKDILGSRLKKLHSAPPVLIFCYENPRFPFYKEHSFLSGLIGAIDNTAASLRGELSDNESEDIANNLHMDHIFPGVTLSARDIACITRFIQQSVRQKIKVLGLVKPGFQFEIDVTHDITSPSIPPDLGLQYDELFMSVRRACQLAWVGLRITFLSPRSDSQTYAIKYIAKSGFRTLETKWYTLDTGMTQEQEREGEQLLAQVGWHSRLDSSS